MGERMRWADGYIAVDWGTTNRRAYRIDSSGACVDEFEDGRGVLSVPKGEFPAATAEIRTRLGDYPLLLADLDQIRPDRAATLLLVKANVCRTLERRLVQGGFNVLNRGVVLPFPSTGRH